MLLSKVTIDRHLHNHIDRTKSHCGRCPTRIVPYNTCLYTPKTNPSWPAIGINHHYFRPIVGTIIAFSIEHCPGYIKKRNGTQTALQNNAGLSLTLNLRSDESPLCCGDHPPQTSSHITTTDSAGYGDASTHICLLYTSPSPRD